MMTTYNHHLSGGTTLYPEHLEQIKSVLSELVLQIPDLFVMVSDRAGQNIASEGEAGSANLVTLGALIASDMAAGQEIARVTGGGHIPKLILHEGDDMYQFISEAGESMVLFARVPAETPLGLSRNFIIDAAKRLDRIAQESKARQAVQKGGLGDQPLQEQIGNALEDLWSR
jgi:predicted regulator of Ras-like GTPase activity (Roadblock/LC7/MglB family)